MMQTLLVMRRAVVIGRDGVRPANWLANRAHTAYDDLVR